MTKKTIYLIDYKTLLNSYCEAAISSKNEERGINILKTGLKEKLDNHSDAWRKMNLEDFGFEIINIKSTDYHPRKEGIISLGFYFPKL